MNYKGVSKYVAHDFGEAYYIGRSREGKKNLFSEFQRYLIGVQPYAPVFRAHLILRLKVLLIMCVSFTQEI